MSEYDLKTNFILQKDRSYKVTCTDPPENSPRICWYTKSINNPDPVGTLGLFSRRTGKRERGVSKHRQTRFQFSDKGIKEVTRFQFSDEGIKEVTRFQFSDEEIKG